MARVKITEYRAKRLIIGDSYEGTALTTEALKRLSRKGRYVVKVDQGVKKRFKLGLVALDKKVSQIGSTVIPWRKKGYSNFLVEPFFSHAESEEKYISFERVRSGIKILFAEQGGIDIETRPLSVKEFIIVTSNDIEQLPVSENIKNLVSRIIDVFERNFFAFLEINPFVVAGSDVHILDAAALVDSAGVFFVKGAWSEEDLVRDTTKHPIETAVKALDQTTPASLKLNVLNTEGSLFLLLSGGGGSIVIADEVALRGKGNLIGNYGEYSGGPTREETHLYTREVLKLLLGSSKKKKALVIAGGVANFTNIQTTFTGVIGALSEVTEKLRKNRVKIFVRRGGPYEEEGLRDMKAFLEKENLLGSIHGSNDPITSAVDDALIYLAP